MGCLKSRADVEERALPREPERPCARNVARSCTPPAPTLRLYRDRHDLRDHYFAGKRVGHLVTCVAAVTVRVQLRATPAALGARTVVPDLREGTTCYFA